MVVEYFVYYYNIIEKLYCSNKKINASMSNEKYLIILNEN